MGGFAHFRPGVFTGAPVQVARPRLDTPPLGQKNPDMTTPRAPGRRRASHRRNLLRGLGAAAFAMAVWLTVNGAGCASSGSGTGPKIDQQHPAQAEAHYRRALARNPNDAEAHLGLARALAEQGRVDEAAVQFQRAETLDARLARDVAESRRHYARTFTDRAAADLDQGRIDAAEAALHRARTLAPEDPKVSSLEGRLAEKRNDVESALTAYRQAWAGGLHDDATRNGLVNALTATAQGEYDRGDYADAWKLLQEVTRVDPHADVQDLMGTVAYGWAQNSPDADRAGHLDQAVEAFRAYLDRNPDDQDAKFNLATVLLAAQRYGEAADLYEDLIAHDRTDGDLYLALARVHGFLGEGALAQTEEAVGRALRAGQPVKDPSGWARRSAERFPDSDLASVYYDLLAPEAVYTYTLPGGSLVEVWFYWKKGTAEAFRDGGRIGPALALPRP
jgi:tetratricopeptide (TPR) repeat protein